MKLIALMCLENCSKQVRKLFEQYEVKIFSEMDIRGYAPDNAVKYGWWPSDRDLPMYSSLCFAIVSVEKATQIMDGVEAIVKQDETGHPVKAFVLDIERMI
ncbi:MAG: hypothetical protein HGB19_03610 [Chlorobiales bacterium]|jgi:hypothetical protein|nr:hypothetical protein [Chlorobiales bacterium]